MLDIINKLTLSLFLALFRSFKHTSLYSRHPFFFIFLSLSFSLSNSLISVSTGTFLLKIYGKPCVFPPLLFVSWCLLAIKRRSRGTASSFSIPRCLSSRCRCSPSRSPATSLDWCFADAAWHCCHRQRVAVAASPRRADRPTRDACLDRT